KNNSMYAMCAALAAHSPRLSQFQLFWPPGTCGSSCCSRLVFRAMAVGAHGLEHDQQVLRRCVAADEGVRVRDDVDVRPPVVGLVPVQAPTVVAGGGAHPRLVGARGEGSEGAGIGQLGSVE